MARKAKEPDPDRFVGGRERRPGVWELRVQLPVDPDRPGNYRTKSITHHGDYRSAIAAHAAAEKKAAAGGFEPTTGPDTIGKLLTDYLAAAGPTWELNTLSKNRSMVNNHLVPAFGRIATDRLTPATIETAYRKWAAAGVGASTIARAHAVLRAALNDAVRLELVDRNAAALARAPRQPKRRAPRFTIADAAKVIALAAAGAPAVKAQKAPAIAPSEMMATIIRLGAVTGARRGELAALRWEDIDLKAGTVTITHNVVIHERRTVRKTTKSDDRTRELLSIDPGTVAVLKRWRKASAEIGLAHGWTTGPRAAVFRRPDTNDHIRPDYITRAWRRLADRAGYPDVHFHDCRHAAATQLVGDGFDVVTVSDMLGHAQRSTTLDMYSHGLAANQQRAAAHLGSILDAG